MVKNLPANAGDAGLIPGLARFPGEGNSHSLQYSCLENPISDYGLILLVTSPHPGATQSWCIGTNAASSALLTHLEIYKDFLGGAVVNNQLPMQEMQV